MEVVEHARQQRVASRSLGRDGQEAGGLVHDQDVRVLVEHGEAGPDGAANRSSGVKRDFGLRTHREPGFLSGDAVDVDLAAPDRLARRAPRQRESLRHREIEPHRFAPSGTRISTKKPGSPIRAPGRAPGP